MKFNTGSNTRWMFHRKLVITGLMITLSAGCSDIRFGSEGATSAKLSAPSQEGTGGAEGDSDNTSPLDPDSPSAPPQSESPSDPIVEPGMPNEEQEQITSNAACLDLLELSTGNQDKRSGRNYDFSGNNGALFFENAQNINLSGTTSSLAVNGADNININGNVGDLCVIAKSINFSGTMKSENSVLVGETGPESSFVAGLNGNNHQALLLKDISVISLNGSYGRVILDNAVILSFAGSIRELHIVNGSELKTSNGHIETYVYH